MPSKLARELEREVISLRSEHADTLIEAVEIETERNDLRRSLESVAGYLATVRSDRVVKDQHGDRFAGQTLDWVGGAREAVEAADLLIKRITAAGRKRSTPTDPAAHQDKVDALSQKIAERVIQRLYGKYGNEALTLHVGEAVKEVLEGER